MSTWWVSSLGNDANPGTGYDYNGTDTAGSEAKLTLGGIFALGGLAAGDEVVIVADGDHTWPLVAGEADVKADINGSDFVTNYSLLIRGGDEWGNPRHATVKAKVADGTGARSWLRMVADTSYVIVRNITFNAIDMPTDVSAYSCSRVYDNGTPNPGPIQFEGCTLLGTDLGVFHSGTRTFMSVSTTGPPAGTEVCNLIKCYAQNTGVIINIGATLEKTIDQSVIYRDAPSVTSILSQTLGDGTGGELTFTKNTFYQSLGASTLGLPIIYNINIGLNAGTVNVYSNLLYQQAENHPANHGFMGDSVGGDKTGVTLSGTIDYNVLIGGKDITAGDLRTDGYYQGAWDPDQNDATGSDTWPNDVVDYEVYEASIFANPTSVYAWDQLGNGATTVIPRDLRPIDHLTAGRFGLVPGALPSHTPEDVAWPRVMPDRPVVETWGWLTSNVTAYNGSDEQRMSLRLQPRKTMQFNMLIEDEDRRREEYRRLYAVGNGKLRIPFYQYATSLTAGSASAATKIFFDPDKTDVRDNETVIIYRPSNEDTFAVEMTTVVSDGANTALPLDQELLATDFIIPSELFFVDNRLAISMRSVHGRMSIKGTTAGIRSTFPRPGSSAVIDTYDSLNVLDHRPLSRDDAQEQFDRFPVEFDNETGIYSTKIHWLHSFIDGMRSFHISRQVDQTEMDYWRDFLHVSRGRRDPFLMPTFREDFVLNAIPGYSSSTIDVVTEDYTSAYFPYDTYKRLRLETPDGDVIYRKVNSTLVLTPTTQRLTLDSALPGTGQWNGSFTIGYLNRVRLGSDQVTLTHYSSYTILELNVRTTDT